MKIRNLSLIASSVILGSALFVGCGGSSSGGGAVVAPPVVNSYLVYLPSSAYDSSNSLSLVDTNNTSGTAVKYVGGETTGEIIFPAGTVLEGNITVPSTAIIDSNGNNIYDAGIDKPVGFEMIGTKDDKVITPLTTAVHYGADIDSSLLGEDPIKLLENGDPRAYLAEQAIANALKAGVDPKELKNVKIDENGTADTNSTDTDLAQALKLASEDNVKIMTAALNDTNITTREIIASAESDKTSLINVAVAKIFDTNESTDALNDVNVSGAIADDTATANLIASKPAKLLVSSIKVGGQIVALNGNSFNVTVDTTDKNVTDFSNISFPGVAITKGFDEQTVNLTVKISDSNNDITFTISDAKVTPTDDNSSVKVTLPVGTAIQVDQNGLPALTDIMGNSATAHTNKKLEMSDLSFNATTLTDALDSQKIPDAIDALNTYLSKANTYDVNITFSGLNTATLATDNTTFNGTVTVENSTVVSGDTTAGDNNTTAGDNNTTAGDNNTTTGDNNTTTGDNNTTVVAFDSSLVNFAVNGTLNEATDITSTYKVKTDADAPTSTGANLILYSEDYSKQIGISAGYAEGTKVQIGKFNSSDELISVSEVYTINLANLQGSALAAVSGF